MCPLAPTTHPFIVNAAMAPPAVVTTSVTIPTPPIFVPIFIAASTTSSDGNTPPFIPPLSAPDTISFFCFILLVSSSPYKRLNVKFLALSSLIIANKF